MNVSDQKVFAEAQEQLIGKGHVAPMIAYGTQKPKSAFRMYARAKNLPMDIQFAVSKQIEAYERALQNADDEEEKESIFIEDYVDAEFMSYINESEPYRGIVVSKSQAPCGYLLYDGDIESEIGVIRVIPRTKKEPVYCTVIDGATADAFGYVKNDVLIVSVIAINAAASSKAGIPYLTAEEVIERTKNDPATWNIFARGLTMGVNQCQGAKTIEKLVRYKPRSLQDMSAFVAAIRPGFKSMVNKFLDREKFEYGVPSFDEQLRNDSTGSSWFLYQEDTMKVLNLAGFPLEETYPIIKAISKKKVKVIESAHERFISGFIEYQKAQGETSEGKARENAEMVWQVIYNSAAYQFNCVTGDTRITAWGGDMSMTVEELYRKINNDAGAMLFSLRAMSFDTENKVKVANIVRGVWYCGRQPVYEVLLDNGSAIRCTGEHKFPTPDGEKRLCQLKAGDSWLYCYDHDCDMISLCRISGITYVGIDDVYDVGMGDPYHNYVANDGIVTSNCSHSVAVALDAIYGAYLKAHYPLEYYTTLLDAYSAKGDKDRVSLIKDEMRRGFDIRLVPCRFRQDNRSFSYDKSANTISDALPSIRNLSMAVAEELYRMRDNRYNTFTDLLVDLDSRRPFNATNIEVLIRMDYFAEFGRNGKLLLVWKEFRANYKKTYVESTRQKRLSMLYEIERTAEDVAISPLEQISFEAFHYGTPVSVFPQCKQTYAVLDVDTKYSPKLTLYSIATGRTGTVKVKKSFYNITPLNPGDIMLCGFWQKKPKYTFTDGKATPVPGTEELWVDDYVAVMRHDEIKEEQ